MELTSFEIFQIKWLISEKINELKKDFTKEENLRFREEYEKLIDEYEEMAKKVNNWYEKTLLDEIK